MPLSRCDQIWDGEVRTSFSSLLEIDAAYQMLGGSLRVKGTCAQMARTAAARPTATEGC